MVCLLSYVLNLYVESTEGEVSVGTACKNSACKKVSNTPLDVFRQKWPFLECFLIKFLSNML